MILKMKQIIKKKTIRIFQKKNNKNQKVNKNIFKIYKMKWKN